MPELKPKSPSFSRVEMADLIMPAQTNHHGTVFGGEVMSYVDRIAAICATRHAGNPVVTASFDSLDFLAPIKLGQTIILIAMITWAGRSSMEIRVKIEGENMITGERKVTGVSYLTFVAVDADGKPVPVPPLAPETDEEKQLYESAEERREIRKQRRLGIIAQI